MTYQEADARLTGRCSTRRKLENNTYLIRCRYTLNAIAVQLHNTEIIKFFPDGRIEVCNGGYPTITTHDRLNRYLPRPYHVHGEPVRNGRSGGDGATVLSNGNGKECLVDNNASISADGLIEGGNVQEYRDQRREERNAANRIRNRARYWVRKARGIFTDRSQCKAVRRWDCDSRRRFQRDNGMGTRPCGCRVYYKQPVFNGTVESIMQEENVTVRVAMMNCYGMEKFFLDSKAKVLDDKAGYQLLSLPFDRWNEMKALKMTCPSTGAVYVNAVPPNLNEVPAALDWMFNTENYLETVTQQS